MAKKISNAKHTVGQASSSSLVDAINDAALVNKASDLVYETPVLIHYGDVRDVTLGPTVGSGESGNELGRRNPP